MPLKTLFLNPPSFENFDGGASSRWPATREIESYWYPVWLAYPAGMLEGSRLLDAPPHHRRWLGSRTSAVWPRHGNTRSSDVEGGRFARCRTQCFGEEEGTPVDRISSSCGRRQKNDGTPPNAPIDHWPTACNRLDSLGFSAWQRMLI